MHASQSFTSSRQVIVDAFSLSLSFNVPLPLLPPLHFFSNRDWSHTAPLNALAMRPAAFPVPRLFPSAYLTYGYDFGGIQVLLSYYHLT